MLPIEPFAALESAQQAYFKSSTTTVHTETRVHYLRLKNSRRTMDPHLFSQVQVASR